MITVMRAKVNGVTFKIINLSNGTYSIYRGTKLIDKGIHMVATAHYLINQCMDREEKSKESK